MLIILSGGVEFSGSIISDLWTYIKKKEKTIINGREYAYVPYEREVKLPVYEEVLREGKRVRVKTKREVSLREILVHRDDEGITSILTSIRTKPAREVAGWLFARWGQENFFKYMIKEYALDHLCSYGVEKLDPSMYQPPTLFPDGRKPEILKRGYVQRSDLGMKLIVCWYTTCLLEAFVGRPFAFQR